MPISSVSRVYDAPDPILENDLELIAKVNTYQQGKFDQGEQAVQDEVNKWAMVSKIAKPELKNYANQKLSNLVSGINDMGGVNLSDINNVNAIKAQGYSIYGDQRIVDGLLTTQKMQALQANSQAKLNGKDAAKYDSSVADYLMKGYNDWATDGDVNNTRYDGAIDLPMGNMNTINEKVKGYLKDLKPDADSMPSGDLQKSYGYFQVDGKWLKGNRIQEAIDAVTDENDSLIFKSHGWKALAGDNDKGLINKLGLIYDNSASAIKGQINYLQAELNQTTDANKKIEYTNLIQQQKTALSENDDEKQQWASKENLSKQEREGIQQSLYKNAWKSNVINSYSYGEEKKELKSNMPLIFHDKMQQQAYQWSKDYDLNVDKYQLDKQELELKKQEFQLKSSLSFSLNGGLNVPLTQVPNKDENNQQKSPQGFIDDINAKYFGMNSQYYQQVYNIMGANDTKGRFTQVNGQWKPKPQFNDQIEKEVGLFNSKLDNYSNLTDEEKKALNLPLSNEELELMFNVRGQINTYKAYKKMAEDKETEIIRNAIGQGTLLADWRNVTVTVGDDNKKMTVSEALALKKAGVLTDEMKVTGFNAVKPTTVDQIQSFVNNIKSLQRVVDNFRSSSEKSYEKIGGHMFNSYSVPIPFTTQSKPLQEIIQKQLSTKINNTTESDDINPLTGKIEVDFKTGKPVYKLQVQSGKAKKLKNEEIDVTDLVQSSPNEGIALYFPKSDVSLIWGLNLSSNGATPFSKNDNYRDALRTQSGNYPFQISSIPNALNGTTGLKVKIALPIGDGNTVEVNVKNVQNGSFTFPSSIESIEEYLNQFLSTPELKQRFYKEHGLTLK